MKMKWLRVSNPLGALVILICMGLTLTIVLGQIVWSLYQGFSPGKVKEELVQSAPGEALEEISSESVLSGLPTTNNHQRLEAVKERIRKLEVEEKALKGELSKSLSSSSLGKPVKVFAKHKRVEQELKTLRSEENRITIDIVRSLNR